jgi:SAM-dependent methyltransferase
LLDDIDFGEGRGEALPLPDAAVDVALSSTVFEEGDADRMLAEIVRVTRPGGRIGIVVRATDMPFWVNLPLDPALKAKVGGPPGLMRGEHVVEFQDRLAERFHVHTARLEPDVPRTRTRALVREFRHPNRCRV